MHPQGFKQGTPPGTCHDRAPFWSLWEQGMQFAWFSAVKRWATLLLSSVFAKCLGRVRAFMVWLISAGPLPTHIAFIMDGNRRFADRLHVDRHFGHSHGYDALLGTLKDCFDLHVKIVTLFAFSIDNFQRPPDEVSALMDLMQSKLESLVEKQGLASEYGIRVQILGDLHLLPEGARMAAEKAMKVTSQNSSRVLNLCISYTSTHEIVQSIQQTRDNFLATWGVAREQSGHPLCNPVNHCANTAWKDSVANGDNVFENGLHIMQGGNDELTVCESNRACNGCNGGYVDCLSDANGRQYANGNGYNRTSNEGGNESDNEVSFEGRMEVELRMLGRKMKSSFVPSNDVTHFIGLRYRKQTEAGVLDYSGLQNPPLDAVGNCDGYVGTATYVDVVKSNGKRADSATIRNGCMLREEMVDELDFDKCNKAFVSCTNDLSTCHQRSSSPNASRKRCHNLQHFHSCGFEAENGCSSTCNSNKPCYPIHRIMEVVNDCVSEEEIEKNLYTYPCPPPDLLIRTSGETRLSNFLLWQTSFSHLAFCKVLWPEFSFRHLFFIILEYQRAFPSLLKKQQYYSSESWRHY